MEQRTQEWQAARLGKATGSRIADIVARTKAGYSTSRANYAAQLVCERLTGLAAESFVSAAMQWGSDKEPEAQRLYAFEHDVEVLKVGFLDHPCIAISGASPDGLIGEAGLIEVKCPLTATHIETLLGQAIPGRYVTQMQWQMAVSGRQWCDFVSYDPTLPADLRLFTGRVHRDEALIAQLERGGLRFPRRGERYAGEARAGGGSEPGRMTAVPLPYVWDGAALHPLPPSPRSRPRASAPAEWWRWRRRSCAPPPAIGITSPASARPGSTCRRVWPSASPPKNTCASMP